MVQLKEYGAFVEIEPGLDGLVHISEVANKRVLNIADELKVGQKIKSEDSRNRYGKAQNKPFDQRSFK